MVNGAHSPLKQQISRASWPDQSDQSLQITRLAHDLQLRDPTEDRFTDIQRNQNEVRPPAAGIHSHHQNVYFIPPPRAGGGAVGASAPVSTVPLGLNTLFINVYICNELGVRPAPAVFRRDRRRLIRFLQITTDTLR